VSLIGIGRICLVFGSCETIDASLLSTGRYRIEVLKLGEYGYDADGAGDEKMDGLIMPE
jgi:hypothetical protein